MSAKKRSIKHLEKMFKNYYFRLRVDIVPLYEERCEEILTRLKLYDREEAKRFKMVVLQRKPSMVEEMDEFFKGAMGDLTLLTAYEKLLKKKEKKREKSQS